MTIGLSLKDVFKRISIKQIQIIDLKKGRQISRYFREIYTSRIHWVARETGTPRDKIKTTLIDEIFRVMGEYVFLK
jgi:hypothetical protein